VKYEWRVEVSSYMVLHEGWKFLFYSKYSGMLRSLLCQWSNITWFVFTLTSLWFLSWDQIQSREQRQVRRQQLNTVKWWWSQLFVIKALIEHNQHFLFIQPLVHGLPPLPSLETHFSIFRNLIIITFTFFINSSMSLFISVYEFIYIKCGSGDWTQVLMLKCSTIWTFVFILF
jgi:hypothetical protein